MANSRYDDCSIQIQIQSKRSRIDFWAVLTRDLRFLFTECRRCSLNSKTDKADCNKIGVETTNKPMALNWKEKEGPSSKQNSDLKLVERDLFEGLRLNSVVNMDQKQ